MERTRRAVVTQIVIVVLWESADQILTEIISERGSQAGIQNARQVVALERAHGFFVEPTWQHFVLHTHSVFGLTLPWQWQVTAANALYALGHPLITLGVALWILLRRTNVFPFFRNAIIGSDIVALIGYKVYPLAPPRMTTGLLYNGRPFHFVDTSLYWFARESNQFGAMPSIHIAYSTIVALTLALTVRSLWLRALVPLYPVAMLVAVVATGNHYLMDALGALGVLAIALPAAILLQWQRRE